MSLNQPLADTRMTNERTGVKGDGERGDFVLVDGQFAVQHASAHGLHRNVKSAQHLVETLVCCMTHSVQRELRRFQHRLLGRTGFLYPVVFKSTRYLLLE